MDTVRATLNGWAIGRCDRVALIVASRPEAFAAYICVAAAATVIPLDPELTEIELVIALRKTEARVVIASEELRHVHDVTRKLGLAVILLSPNAAAGAGAFYLSGGISGIAALPGPAAADDVAAILMSSGTTEDPKAIPITHALVVRRAKIERDQFSLTQNDVCINFRRPYLSSPLNSGLMPALIAGGGVVVPESFDADGFFDALTEFGVSWYSCGTAHHEALLERAPFHQDAIKASRLRFIRAAGNILPVKTFRSIEATFGVVCIEAYASTECGTICCNPMPPGPRKPGTVGLPLGCEVSILDEHGARLPPGEEGEITVRGPNLFKGYDRNDAARNASVLADGWFRTGDLGRFDDDGYLTISGRVSEVINRGGQKVSPPEVERALLSHSDVNDCLCFPIKHPTLGQLVAAAVVLRPGTVLDEAGLRDFVRGRLSLFKIPARIVQWDEIPRASTGKPQRAKASEKFARLHSSASQNAEPRAGAPSANYQTAIVRSLAGIWCYVLGLENIAADEDFFLSGGDSLRAVQLLAEVANAFGVELAPDILFEEGATIAGMAKAIDAARSRPRPADRQPAPVVDELASTDINNLDEILRRLRSSARSWPGDNIGIGIPFFALNPRGKLPAIFWCFNTMTEPKEMSRVLGPDRPIYAMRSLSSVLGEKGYKERFVGDLALLYIDEILRLPQPGPYFIGGNCQSGPIAESIAHLLMYRGRSVAQLSLLEYEPRAPYPGRVALFFGAESAKFNPFLKKAAPEETWKRLHKEVVWDIIPGNHGQYFGMPNLAAFMDRLEARLAEAQA